MACVSIPFSMKYSAAPRRGESSDRCCTETAGCQEQRHSHIEISKCSGKKGQREREIQHRASTVWLEMKENGISRVSVHGPQSYLEIVVLTKKDQIDNVHVIQNYN